MISVIIPAFNEEKSIGDVLTRVFRAVELHSLPCEIIVVNDGSTDRTRKLACNHGATVLCNEKNRGKGHALARGFKTAKGDIIVTMDADGSHNPEDINKLILPILNGADIVLGSRFATGEGKNSTKRLHVFGNLLINFLILMMTGKNVTDSQTGFRAFRKKVLQEIEITSKGYQVETELTVKMLRSGRTVKEVAVISRKRMNGYSRINPFGDGLRILRAILKWSVTR
jgi:glycosyltransferase involved in cell wall biosynthesis